MQKFQRAIVSRMSPKRMRTKVILSPLVSRLSSVVYLVGSRNLYIIREKDIPYYPEISVRGNQFRVTDDQLQNYLEYLAFCSTKMIVVQLFSILFLYSLHVLALPRADAPAPARDATVPDITDQGQMSVAVASALATWTPHAPPKATDPINEWAGLGDSYASGIGSNGLPDGLGWGAPCSRYKMSWVLQVNGDTRWPGDNTQRKADFGACAGNQMVDLREKQVS